MVEAISHDFVKICGITNIEDALSVIEAGADAIGLVFAPSARRVTPEQAGPILEAARGRTLRVAVLRELADDEVLALLERVEVDAVQLHDPLSATLVRELRDQGLIVIKALSIEAPDFDTFDESPVDVVLVDGPRPGSGRAHSWEPLARRPFAVPVIAAGGLTPVNVGEVISMTHVSGVDSSSGVESSPGKKDRALVVSFVERAKAAFATMESAW